MESRPRYRLRYWPMGDKPQWQVNLVGAKDVYATSTDWWKTSGAAIEQAAVIHRDRVTAWS